MEKGSRRHARHPIDCEVAVSWQDKQGAFKYVQARGRDLSEAGASIEAQEPIEVNAYVYVRAEKFGLGGAARVRHCSRRGAKYLIGIELTEMKTDSEAGDAEPADYYELLQISPTAEAETISRVYKILVARYHPDNPHTGDAEKFLELQKAYETLSNPEKRAAYDGQYRLRQLHPIPVFELKEFIGGIEAEANRRLGMLCLLYNRRRMDADKPGYSILDFEHLMSLPREHLMFTVWFLKEKGYVKTEGGFEFEITAAGVEFVEASVPSNRILYKLLRAPEGETVRAQAG